MAQMKKFSRLKIVLTGGILLSLLVTSLLSFNLVSKGNTQAIKDKTMVIANGVLETIKTKESDVSKVLEDTWLGAIQNANIYATLLGLEWKRTFNSLTNDDLLVLAKDLGFSDITIYSIDNNSVTGVLSTQPNKIGIGLDKTEEEKEIRDFLLKSKAEESLPLSQTLKSYQNSVASSLFQYDKIPHTTVYTYVPDFDKVIALGVPLTDYKYFEETNSLDKTIEAMKASNPYLVEIGVIDTTDFKPQEKEVKTVAGTFKYSATSDNDFLANAGKEGYPLTSTYVMAVGDKQLFKHLEVIEENKVVYIGLDYTAILEGKQNSHIVVLLLFLLTTIISGVLLYLHSKKEKDYHEKIQKRLNTLAKGIYNLKTLNVKEDEYKEILDALNALTIDLRTRKNTLKEPMQRIEDIIQVITEGRVRTSSDLDELRHELKVVLHDLKGILRIED